MVGHRREEVLLQRSEKSRMDAHDSYSSLRIPDYRRLLAGNVLSSAGFEMQAVAVGWELYERTSSPTALGLVGLALFLPVVLLALPAGHVADRFNRRKLLVAAQSLMGMVSVMLAVISFGGGPTWVIYVCLVLVGVCQAFRAPARASLLSEVVPREELANAVSWNSSGWHIASMGGPAAGGFAIAWTGSAGWAYLIAALLAFICVGLVFLIRPRTDSAARHEEVSLKSLLAGIRFVWRSKLLLATMTLDLFAVLLGGATALLPIFARDILEIGADGLGWLRAAPSIGALSMALIMAHRPPLRRAGPTLLWAVAGFGAATIVFGISQNALLSFIMLAVTGALDNVSVVVRGTLIQTLTPNAMRGRVSAVNAIFIGSSNELGAFESGMTAEWWGPVGSVVVGGIGTIVVVLTVMRRWPQVARLRSLKESYLLVPEAREVLE